MADLLVASVIGANYPEIHTFQISGSGSVLTQVDTDYPSGLIPGLPDAGQVLSSFNRSYLCYQPNSGGGAAGQLASFSLDGSGNLAAISYSPDDAVQSGNGLETDGNFLFVWSIGSYHFWVHKDDGAGNLSHIKSMEGPGTGIIRSMKFNQSFLFLLDGDSSGQARIYSGYVNGAGDWTTVDTKLVPNTPAPLEYPVSMAVVGDFLVTGTLYGQIDSWSVSGSGVITHVDTYNVVNSGTEPTVIGLMEMHGWIIAITYDNSNPGVQVLSLALDGLGNLSLIEQFGLNSVPHLGGREHQFAKFGEYFYIPLENGIHVGLMNPVNGDLMGGVGLMGPPCFSITNPRLLSPARVSGYTVNHNGSRRWPSSTVHLIDESTGEVVDTTVSDEMGWFEFSTWEIAKTFTVVADAPGVRAGARSGITPVP